jgi:hypothetical protein
MNPAESPIWKSLLLYREEIKTNGLTGKERRYYTWDYLHSEIEVFDRRGKHLGAIGALTGEFIKSAVEGRRIKL